MIRQVKALNIDIEWNSSNLKKELEQLMSSLLDLENVVLKITRDSLPALGQAIHSQSEEIKSFNTKVSDTLSAFDGWSVIDTVTSSLGNLSDALSIVTSAQDIWKKALKGDYIGAAISGIGLLVDAIKILAKGFGGEAAEYHRIREDIVRETEARKKNYDQMQRSIDARKQELDNIPLLKRELDNLVDSNGKIKDGYEERVKFITGKLTEAYGIEVRIVDGVVDKYGELGEALDTVYTRKQAQSIANAYKPMLDYISKELPKATDNYKKALEKWNKYDKDYVEENGELYSRLATYNGKPYLEASDIKKNEYYRFKENAKDTKKILDDLNMDHINASQALHIASTGNIDEMKNMIANFQYTTDENGQIHRQSLEGTYKNTSDTIKQYQELLNNTTDEDSKEIIQKEIDRQQALLDITSNAMVGKIGLINAHGESFELSFEELMNRAKEGIINGGEPVNLAMNENMAAIITAITNSEIPIEEQTQKLADIQAKVFTGAVPVVAEAEQQAMHAILAKISETNPQMADAVRGLLNAGILQIVDGKLEFSQKARELGLDGSESIKKMRNEYEAASRNLMEGSSQGINKNAYLFLNSVAGTARDAIANVKKELGIESPSKVFRNLLKEVPRGMALGINDTADVAIKSMSNLAKGMISEYDEQMELFSPNDIFDKLPDQEIKVTGILDKIKNLNASGLVQRIKAEVMASQSTIAGTVARSNYNVTPNHQSTAQNTETVSEPKYIENTVVIDGREVAKVMTPHISKRLAWEG